MIQEAGGHCGPRVRGAWAVRSSSEQGLWFESKAWQMCSFFAARSLALGSTPEAHCMISRSLLRLLAAALAQWSERVRQNGLRQWTCHPLPRSMRLPPLRTRTSVRSQGTAHISAFFLASCVPSHGSTPAAEHILSVASSRLQQQPS